MVRDRARAEGRFAEQLKDQIADTDDLKLIVGSVESLPEFCESVDYIVHAACSTASKAFVEKPVDVIQTAVIGTDNVLKLAREKGIKGFVYLTSMEVYGYPDTLYMVLDCTKLKSLGWKPVGLSK